MLFSLLVAGAALFVLFGLIREEPRALGPPRDAAEEREPIALFSFPDIIGQPLQMDRVEIGPPSGIGPRRAGGEEGLLKEFLLCSEIEDFREIVDRWGGRDRSDVPLFCSLLRKGASLETGIRELLHEVVCQSLEMMVGPEEAAALLLGFHAETLPPVIESFLARSADAATMEQCLLLQEDSRILLHVPPWRLARFSIPVLDADDGPGGCFTGEGVAHTGLLPVHHPKRAGIVRYLALKRDAAAVDAITATFVDRNGDPSLQRARYSRFKASVWPDLLEALPASELARLLGFFQVDPSRLASLKLELVLDTAAAGRLRDEAGGFREAALRLAGERPDLRAKAVAACIGSAPGPIGPGSAFFQELDELAEDGDLTVIESAGCLPVLLGLELLAVQMEAIPPGDRQRRIGWVRQIEEHLALLINTRFMEPVTVEKIRIVRGAGDLALVISKKPWRLEMHDYPKIVQTALSCYLRSLAGEPRRNFNDVIEALHVENAIDAPGLEAELCAGAYARLLLPLLPLDLAALETTLRNPDLMERRSAAILLLFLKRCASIRRDAAHPLLDEYIDLYCRHENRGVRVEALRLAYRAAMTREEIDNLFGRSLGAHDEESMAVACEEIPHLFGQGLVGVECITESIGRAVREGNAEQIETCFDTLEDSLPGFLAKRRDLEMVARFLEKIAGNPGLDRDTERALFGLMRDIDTIRNKEK